MASQSISDQSKSQSCSTPGCSAMATMKCPKCIELGIADSYFCSQPCFKSYWKTHKAVHEMLTKMKSIKVVNNFQNGDDASSDAISRDLYPSFSYSGDIRPHSQTPRKTLPSHIARPDYAITGIPESEQKTRGSSNIEILASEEEREDMRLVCRLAREILDEAVAFVRDNWSPERRITTDDIDRVVHEAHIERDCYPSPLNYYEFPKSCCTSINEVICHGIPDLRPLQHGDLLNIDITAYHRGFHGDLNETFMVGKPPSATSLSSPNQLASSWEASLKLISTAHQCLAEAIQFVRPGRRFRDVGDVISKVAAQNQCSVVRSYCGHGCHRLFHCAPNVPHYAKNKAIGVMKPGQCFTIEPMINAGGWADTTWPDNWTAVTTDGKRSAQFEETMLVTEEGVEVLTRRRDAQGNQLGPYFLDGTAA